jgi:hypothetical protein
MLLLVLCVVGGGGGVDVTPALVYRRLVLSLTRRT